jgi:hypothetical protein
MRPGPQESIVSVVCRVGIGVTLLTLCACARGGEQVSTGDSLVPTRIEGDASEGCPYDGVGWTCPLGERIALRAVATYDSSGESVLLKTIEITPARGAIERQSLRIEDSMTPLAPHHVSAADMDGDGYADFMVTRQFGHPNNSGNYTWRFDPARRRLVYDSLLSTETNVSPESKGCVHTSGWLGRNDTIESRYCLRDGVWIEVWVLRTDTDDSGVQIQREYRLDGDSLKLVKADTLRN